MLRRDVRLHNRVFTPNPNLRMNKIISFFICRSAVIKLMCILQRFIQMDFQHCILSLFATGNNVYLLTNQKQHHFRSRHLTFLMTLSRAAVVDKANDADDQTVLKTQTLQLSTGQ